MLSKSMEYLPFKKEELETIEQEWDSETNKQKTIETNKETSLIKSKEGKKLKSLEFKGTLMHK